MLHGQKGSFIPGGSCMPAMAPAIFSCTRASTRCTASLTAAAMQILQQFAVVARHRRFDLRLSSLHGGRSW